MALLMVYDIAAKKGADRNTSVLLERCWGRSSLAGFHRIRYPRESHPGRVGFIILIGWKYMTRPTVKIIYAPNIRSSFCYNRNNNLYKGKEDTKKPALQNFALQNFALQNFQKPYCVLCDMNSHKLSSGNKKSKKHKNEDCLGRKNGLCLACLKCNSKCHIPALNLKPLPFILIWE